MMIEFFVKTENDYIIRNLSEYHRIMKIILYLPHKYIQKLYHFDNKIIIKFIFMIPKCYY